MEAMEFLETLHELCMWFLYTRSTNFQIEDFRNTELGKTLKDDISHLQDYN